jgi:guanylate kinase
MTPEQLSFDLLHPHPLLIVISGTSGVGKDSVIKGLKRRNLPLHIVVTATTRAPRKEEVHGRDYFFYSRREFEERVAKGEFIEHAQVYTDLKGIPRCQIEDALASGMDVVARVDVQGAATLRGLYPQALMIFIVPRSFDEWYERLMRRNTEGGEDLRVRIETARKEVAQIDMFDYIVVNAENLLEKAVDDIATIIAAEHMAVNHRRIL